MNQSQSNSHHSRSSVVYMLRTAQQHHVQLSALADQKASILIGASLVVMTLLLGQFSIGKVSLPLIILAGSTLISAFFAVLVVMPSVGKTLKGESNPLFFGTFIHQSKEEFLNNITQLIESDESVYRAMMLDIYQMGTVLYAKKYRWLTYSYRTFLVGLILTALATVGVYQRII